YSTVGIESPDQQDGIEVCYWNAYNPGAAPLQAGRAYLFTPDFDSSQPGADFFVTLVPFGMPIVLPPSGGDVNYNITFGNSGQIPASADIWCMLTLPNGLSFGPVLGPIRNFPFPANWSASRDRTLSVPARSEPGNYIYHAYIGSYPAIASAHDSFAFTKLAGQGDGAGFGGLDDWLDSGDPFTVEPCGQIQNIPQSYALHPAHPNPFNPRTTIGFALPEAGQVKLEVFDTAGRLVQTLQNGFLVAGEHEASWDASSLPSGLYLCRLRSDKFNAVQKVLLIK
ncbi:MAG TPA: T9SS type A sorting domain-containing protein, partial [bacterium]